MTFSKVHPIFVGGIILVIIFLCLFVLVFVLVIPEKAAFKEGNIKIIQNNVGSWWTKGYKEEGNCVSFIDRNGISHKICGNYQIEKQ